MNILRRIKNRLRPGSPGVKTPQNVNFQCGSRSRIENLNIGILHSETDRQNISIGQDCNISGSFSIYSPNAKIVIGDRVFIGPGTNLVCYDEIRIGDDVMISWDCTIMDTNAHSLVSSERLNDVLDWNKGHEYKDWSKIESKKIHIGSKSWVGFKSIILKGVIAGEGSIIASGSVVTKNIEPYSIVGGNPAKFIKKTT